MSIAPSAQCRPTRPPGPHAGPGRLENL